MHRDKHADGPGWGPLNIESDGSRDTSLRYDVNRALVVSIIAVSTVAVAAIDFGTSSEFIGSILFIVPLALCRWQRSERVLVATTVVASLLTMAAGLWGIERGPGVPWDDAVNRGLLVASFVTFAIFIRLGMKSARLHVEDSAKIAAERNDLIARHADLPALVASYAREADERQTATTMIAQSESRYRGLLEAAPDAMIVSDRHGQILLINSETQRMFGYERAELVGQTIDVLVPERFRGGHSGHRNAYTAHPRTRPMGEGRKLQGLRRDGSEFPVEISLSPIEMPDGILITTAIRDITSRGCGARRRCG